MEFEGNSLIKKCQADSGKSKTKFKCKEKLVIATLSLSNMFFTYVYGFLGVFGSQEASSRGVSKFEMTIIFSIYYLSATIASPLIGSLMPKVGPRNMMVFGLTVLTFTTFSLSIAPMANDKSTFLSALLTIRAVEGIAFISTLTATFSIISELFAQHISTVTGIIEMFIACGYGFGAMMGGVLYNIGGFKLPYISMVVPCIILTVVASSIIPVIRKEVIITKYDAIKDCSRFVRYPSFIFPIFAVFQVYAHFSLTMTDYSPFFSNTYHVSETIIGLVQASGSISYALCSYPIGYLIDKYELVESMMILGGILRFVAYAPMGPYPFLPFESPFWLQPISVIAGAFCNNLMYIPCLQYFLKEAKYNNLELSFQLKAVISSTMASCTALGQLVAPLVTNTAVSAIGFSWTSFIFGLLGLFNVVLTLINKLIKYKITNKN